MRTDDSPAGTLGGVRARSGLIRNTGAHGVPALVLASCLAACLGLWLSAPAFAAEPTKAPAAKPSSAPAPSGKPAASGTPPGVDAPDAPVTPDVSAAPAAPPEPDVPKKLVKSLPSSPGGSYTLSENESHRGNLYLAGTKLLLAGDQDGDVYFVGQSLQVTGKVSGDITGACQQATFGGRVEESVLFASTSSIFIGEFDKDVTIAGTTIEFLDTAHVAGEVSASGADMTFRGRVDGDAAFKGGAVLIGGTIKGDCTVEAGRLEFGPGARVEGDLFYKVQEPIAGDLAKIVGGSLHENESPDPEREKRDSAKAGSDDDDDRGPRLVGTGGFAWSIFCILGSMVVGSVCLALFPVTSRGAVEAIRTDPLRTAGLGFVAAIVIPFALILSCILIVTIPFALILLFTWALTFFLIAALPVAVWAGKWLLAKMRRPDASLYLALLTGCVVLTVLYQIPGLCILLWLVVHFLGFGGIASVTWSAWQSRRAAKVAAAGGPAGGPGAPPPPPPPSDPPPAGYAPQTFGTGGA